MAPMIHAHPFVHPDVAAVLTQWARAFRAEPYAHADGVALNDAFAAAHVAPTPAAIVRTAAWLADEGWERLRPRVGGKRPARWRPSL